MKTNRLFLSTLPLLLVILSGLTVNDSIIEVDENVDITYETVLQSEIDFVNDVSEGEASSCDNIESGCPCGNKCESHPGGVCTRCSEWQTGSKYKPCDYTVIDEEH